MQLMIRNMLMIFAILILKTTHMLMSTSLPLRM
jgi:hypothetical protein